MKTVIRSSFFVVVLLTALLIQPTMAQETVENPDVVLLVDGLACPLCAYGLEKNLKKIDSVQAISIELEKGEVRVKLKEDAKIAEDHIRKAVVDAGFTLNQIEYRDKKADSSSDV